MNISVGAGFNLIWQLDKYLPYLHSNDILYLPLEYVTEVGAGATVGTEAAYLVAYDHTSLLHLYTPPEALSAVFGFNILDAFESVGEIGLSAAGKQTRYSVQTLTPHGDEFDHDIKHTAEYAVFIRSQGAPRPMAAIHRSEKEMKQVSGVIRVANDKGVIAVGRLPTTVAGTELSDDLLAAVRDYYVGHGACFLALPNRSLYPVADFYDSNYHLAEPTQLRHSQLVGAALRDVAMNGCRANMVGAITN